VGFKIDDAEAVIAQFRDEQSLPRDVDCHVIDAPAHWTKWNLALKPQKLHRRGRLSQRGYR
jgi:hypothetical protein